MDDKLIAAIALAELALPPLAVWAYFACWSNPRLRRRLAEQDEQHRAACLAQFNATIEDTSNSPRTRRRERMTKEELQHAISTTLGDHIGDFNIPGIADAILDDYGPLNSLDDVPTDDYWKIVKAYDAAEIPNPE